VGGNFGQREHLALILTLPLALLAALRMAGGAIPAGPARAIGAAAAVGIALKPYFVLPWLALEVASRIPPGPGRHGLRPETVAVVVTGALYVVLALLLSPEYWRLAPLIAGTYYDYLRNPLAVTAVAGEGAAPTAAALLIALLLRRHARHPELWTVFGALTAGYYAAAVAQHKGWEYHFYPAFASGTMLVALVAADLRRPLGSLPRRIAAAAAQAAAVTVFALALAACLARAGDPSARRFEPDPDLPDLLPLVAERAARGPITVLSWSAVSGFPLIPDAGARSGNRFNFLWMLGSLYGPATADPAPLVYRGPDRMGPLERYLNAAVAADLRRHRPALLLVLAPAPDSPEWGLRRIDLLTYFQRDPRFAEQFGRYRYLRTIGQYWVFERLPEGAPPAPPRAGTSRWDPATLEAARQAQSARRLDPASVAAILLFLLSFGLAWSRDARGESRPVPDPQEVV
jgi:hypothetical protein